MDTLLQSPQPASCAIVVWDVSGSTANPWENGRPRQVYDRMADVVRELDHRLFRFVFWSSPNTCMGRLQRGVCVLPMALPKSDIDTAIALGKTCVGGGTAPCVGFEALPREWLSGDCVLYFITDGQIGCSELSELSNKQRLVACLRDLPIPLRILAVENVRRDFNNSEQVNAAAGGDIYALVQEHHLSDRVRQFVVHSLSGTSVQIDRAVTPPGYAPYGNKYFSLLRAAEFRQFIRAEVTKASGDTDAQMSIAQRLAASLEVLTRDKPAAVQNDILRTFAQLFTLPSALVQWILSDGIERERAGSAAVLAHFRSSAKSLFAKADALLRRDVRLAVGMDDEFVTDVYEGRVLRGPARLVLSTVAGSFPRGGFTSTLPCFPILRAALSPDQDQCLRQWIRSVYASRYHLHPTSEEILHVVLGNVLRVVRSGSVSQDVKDGYRQLGFCMLRKARLNSVQTEWDRLLAAELPLPNSGRMEDFSRCMDVVRRKLGLQGETWHLWLAMCEALDPTLWQAQRRCCPTEETKNMPPAEIRVVEDSVPESYSLDYTCLVTLEDISAKGGWRIRPHHTEASVCRPVYLLSEAGKATLLASANCVCPLCFSPLDPSSFEPVGPKQNWELPACYLASPAPAPPSASPTSPAPSPASLTSSPASLTPSPASLAPSPASPAPSPAASPACKVTGKPGKLVVMHGPVGAGKTTWSNRVADVVRARGGVCLVEGMDQHDGDAKAVTSALLAGVSACQSDDLVVVIDTCGVGVHQRDVFHLDFRGWRRFDVWPCWDKTQPLSHFMAWSLRNVLSRPAPTPQDPWRLCPATSSASTCIHVHRTKCQQVFGKRDAAQHWVFENATVESLAALADAYRVPDFAMPPGL